MPNVELRRLVGQLRDQRTGKVRNVGWNMDQLFLDGKQIATINHVPGASVGLMQGVLLSAAEREAVQLAIAAKRGGVKPASIRGAISVDFEILDDADVEDDTNVDEVDGE